MTRKYSHGQQKNKFLESLLQYLRINKIKKHIFKDAKILDIGCGYDGKLLKILEKYKIDGYGVDLYVNPNNDRLKTNDLNKQLQFDNNTFDIITFLAVLEHLENNNIFNEIYRILKPNGKLLLTTPTIYSKPILELLAFKLKLIDTNEIKDHKHYYSKNELIYLTKRLDLKIYNISTFNFL